MECVASHFVGGDVRGYFTNNFSKVEDDVVYYNCADQKKSKAILFSPSFWLYFNGRIYEYEDKVKLMILRKVFKETLIRWKKCDEVACVPLKKCNGGLECICNFCLMGSFKTTPFAVCSNML